MEIAAFAEGQLPPTPALHHIPDLAGALNKVARLLGPGGRLIVREHAWERMDEPTARCFMERFFAWTPYLYTELGGAPAEAEERVLVEGGKIQAIGFNYAGET